MEVDSDVMDVEPGIMLIEREGCREILYVDSNGKYWDEMHDAVLHWRYLQCAAPRYWPLPRQLATLWGWPPRLMLVVAAGRRWVDPIGGQRAVDRGYATRHVVLDPTAAAWLLVVGAALIRITASCASMYGPKCAPRSPPELPTTAHESKRQRSGCEVLRW